MNNYFAMMFIKKYIAGNNNNLDISLEKNILSLEFFLAAAR